MGDLLIIWTRFALDTAAPLDTLRFRQKKTENRLFPVYN